MRHLVRGKKLGRTTPHRKAMLRNLAISLIKEHRIQTTVNKAKALRQFIEPLITKAKEDTHNNRRQVFSSLQNNYAINELFDEIGPLAMDRPGGYTRVVKAGFRKGDGAELAIIELVDYNDVQPEGRKSKKKRTRRAGKSNKPTSAKKETDDKKTSEIENDTAELSEEEAKESEN